MAKIRHSENKAKIRNFHRIDIRNLIESSKDFDYEESRKDRGLRPKKRKRKNYHENRR